MSPTVTLVVGALLIFLGATGRGEAVLRDILHGPAKNSAGLPDRNKQ